MSTGEKLWRWCLNGPLWKHTPWPVQQRIIARNRRLDGFTSRGYHRSPFGK